MRPLFTPFQNASSAALFLESRYDPAEVCSEESGPFCPPKWDPFWCDIWENYQCMGGAGKRLASSFAIGWSTAQPTFGDGRYEWPWATIGHGETPPSPPLLAHFTYPSSVLLSVSPVGLLFHSPAIVLLCLLLLIHHPNGVPCRFKVRSDSLCGPCRPSP